MSFSLTISFLHRSIKAKVIFNIIWAPNISTWTVNVIILKKCFMKQDFLIWFWLTYYHPELKKEMSEWVTNFTD